MKSYENTINYLNLLKMKGALNSLQEIINDAEIQTHSYTTFLNSILNAEIENRNMNRLKRNMIAAHFPVEKKFNVFDFGRVSGIGKTDIANLKDCRWIDRKENLLFFGPPGIGKTHLAISFGINAVEKGYSVCFERISSLMKYLKVSEIQKMAQHRINRILKSNLFIIDEIGYTPIDRKEANLFFNLISEMYEKSSIIITSNKSFDEWAEMMGDSIMTTALLDRLLHHAKIYNLDGNSFRLKDKIKKEVK
ncbi:MAG: IS21-like element helper ATPase IstB [Candidatus Omnitrophica bacterium]|nr:IS21-like element helper ATPase IstB [Spirochaetota bacterium]MCK5491779.1 IS21-like element helper ATPase IstB [Candidatus Omnitrophota bacterium]